MYNNRFGYGVYKSNQVKVGKPYKPESISAGESVVEDIFKDVAAASEANPDRELRISQDIIYKAKEEAAIIKREAELEAEKIISEAKTNSERQAVEIQQTAKEEGYRVGEELAQKHYNDLLEEAEEYRNRSKREFEQTLENMERDIVDLILSISEKVVGKIISDNQESVIEIIKDTINSCSNRENVVLKVSPYDYDFVIENEELLRFSIKGVNELEIKKDNSLAKGSCIIDTELGSVDGSSEIRLQSIRKAFFELMGEDGIKNE